MFENFRTGGVSPEFCYCPSGWASRRIAQGCALLFTFATPETVFAVFSGPTAAGKEDLAVVTVRPCERFSPGSSGSSFSRRGEEQVGLSYAQTVRSPLSGT